MAAIAIPAVISGLGALAGLFGMKQQNKGTINQTTTNTPNYDPAAQSFRDQLIAQFTGLTSPDATKSFNNAYQTSGIKAIKSNADVAGNAVNDILAARGITRTGAGASATADSGYRAGSQISSFLANAPIVEQNQEMSRLNNAGGFFSVIPHATTSNVQGKTTGNYTGGGGPGAAVQGGAGNLAYILGQLYAKKLNAPSGGVSDVPGGMDLGSIFSNSGWGGD